MKKRIILKYIDRVILVCLYCVIFFIPCFKAGQEIFTWTAIALWLIKKLLSFKNAEGQLLLPVTQLNKAILIFIIINALSIVSSVNFSLSLRGFFGKVSKFIFLFFIVVETINTRKRLRNTIFVMVMAAGLMVVDAFAQYFWGRDFLRNYQFNRLSASFSTANGFAGWLIVFILLFLGILMLRVSDRAVRRKRLVLLGGLDLLLFVCLLLTNTRGAWLGLAAGLGLFFYFMIKSEFLRIKFSTFSLLIIFLSGVLFISPHAFKERVRSTGDINSNLLRIGLWKEALSIIEDFPVFGCGLNTYSFLAHDYKAVRRGGTYPHNSFLQMAAETGLAGLASFLWILITFFRSGFRILNIKNNPLFLGAISGILAFLIQGFFDTHLYSLQLVVLFWFMMGFATAVSRLEMDVNI